jgi:hypothetical protein
MGREKEADGWNGATDFFCDDNDPNDYLHSKSVGGDGEFPNNKGTKRAVSVFAELEH